MPDRPERNDIPEVPEFPLEVGEERAFREARGENLLGRLLYKGILPRYAFPTDVAGFYVFDPANSLPHRAAYRYAPSQGLPVALSQYAPGKEVWIDGKRFTSGAVYSPVSDERFQAWRERRLYYECVRCRFACTKPLEQGQKGETLDCPACGEPESFGQARYWFRPPGFAHPVTIDEGTSPDDEPARSYPTRAKLVAPTPPSTDPRWVWISDRVRVLSLRDHLLVTNTGPRHEGYSYCTRCGLVEPASRSDGALARAHPKPFPDQREPMCPGGRLATGICLGTDFITDILLVSFRVDAPVRLSAGILSSEIALRTVTESLVKAACHVLQLEQNELQGEFRAALTPDGRRGLESELYLYDSLPGGAGFSRRIGERGAEVLQAALEVLENCNCGLSCYSCLRSYKNKFEHDRLDRHVGRDLLLYGLQGIAPRLSDERSNLAADTLAEDIRRQAGGALTVDRGARLEVPGLGTVTAPIHVRDQRGGQRVVAIAHPLMPGSAPSEALENLMEYTTVPVVLVSELLVRRNLPAATRAVLGSLGYGR